MDGADAITDPTDWADTAVTSLQPVASALRCQVCKEFFTNPVITTCAHTFCSICIRRCLTPDGKCPTCRAEDQPIRLRRNVVVEEVVSAFQAARPEILQMGKEVLTVRQGGEAPSLKRKLEDVSIVEDEEESGPRTRRKTRSQNRRAGRSRTSSVYEISDGESDYAEAKTKKPVADGKVECPICMARMKEEEVSPHIDRVHSEPASGPARPQPAMFGLQRDVRSPSAGTGEKPPERLGGLSYGIMNEQALRKKLQSLGIPAYGTKQVMISRHREWLNIWNANCDSARPRPKRDLLRDLDVWERTQGSQARNNNDTNGIMSKEFDHKAWTKHNGTDFKNLIAQARAKTSAPPPPAEIEQSDPAQPVSSVPTELMSSVNGNSSFMDTVLGVPNAERTNIDQNSTLGEGPGLT